MKVSRRDFLKISAGAGAAATLMNRDVMKQAMSVILQDENKKNLVWIQGQGCNGCTISALSWCGAVPNEITGDNLGSEDDASGTVYTTNLIKVLSETSTDLEFHPTLMPQAGAYWSSDGEEYTPYQASLDSYQADLTYVDAMQHLKDVVTDDSEQTFVIVEGAIPYEKWGDNEHQGFCEVGMKDLGGGEYKEGRMWMFGDIVKYCHDADGVAAMIAFGNCAAFGGIPGGNPNPTGAKGLQHFLEDVYGVGNHKPVININDCPAHPEHLVYTYAAILTAYDDHGDWDTVLDALGSYIELDQWNRPEQVYIADLGWINLFGEQVHYQCERKGAFDSGNFATSFKQAIEDPSKCLLRLGCRGPATFTNCSAKRNSGTGAALSGWNPNGVGIWNNDMDNPLGGAEANPGTWCVAAGSPCYGCGTTSFPDNVFGSGFFRECSHSEMLEAGKFPGDASGATGGEEDYEGKGVACYTCHGRSMPRKFKEWIE